MGILTSHKNGSHNLSFSEMLISQERDPAISGEGTVLSYLLVFSVIREELKCSINVKVYRKLWIIITTIGLKLQTSASHFMYEFPCKYRYKFTFMVGVFLDPSCGFCRLFRSHCLESQ